MPTVTVSQIPEATIDDEQISKWVGNRLNDARNRFLTGMRASPPGKIYKRRKVYHSASLPGEYPRTDGGRLAGSVHIVSEARSGSIYSNLQYADYLDVGTGHLIPRRMLADALSEVLDARPETDELAKAAKIE